MGGSFEKKSSSDSSSESSKSLTVVGAATSGVEPLRARFERRGTDSAKSELSRSLKYGEDFWRTSAFVQSSALPTWTFGKAMRTSWGRGSRVLPVRSEGGQRGVIEKEEDGNDEPETRFASSATSLACFFD